MGTGAHFSLAVLDYLLLNGLKPVALGIPEFAPVILKGLGKTAVDSAVRENQFVLAAERLAVPLIYLPESLQAAEAEKIAELNADYLLLACWPYLLGPEIISRVGMAALNMHPSILPNYRGADPIAEQIKQEEKNLGVSLHLLSQEFDSGDIVSQARLEFEDGSQSREAIEAEAARVGTNLFIKATQDFGGPDWKPVAQNS